MKTTISEVKNTLARINGRLDIAKEKTTQLKGKTIENIQNEMHREKGTFFNEKSIRELYDNITWSPQRIGERGGEPK